ncbi:hypothetical protein Tco_0947224 [Tanacetum coccineum]
MINKKKFSLDVEIFTEILHICPNIPGQEFEDLLLEHDILTFIKNLGHSGDIIYLIDGMFNKKNIDYVYLPWEDLLFQIENKEAKKTNKMSYPRFTKIVIEYFMLKDQFISRRNKMFWHSARDDTMFTSMRCISRHEDTQVYGTILPKELTNQAMLESNAYKTYYAFASREKAPKPKYVRKKADPDTSPNKKLVQATKGTRIKYKAKVAKSNKKKQPAQKPKAKGLAVLSKVALTEAEQLKLATKRSKTQFHSSHASGSGDGVDTQSKVDDEQYLETISVDEGTGTIPGVPDVPIYESKSDDDNDGNNGNDGDDDDANDDDKQEFDDTNDNDKETDNDKVTKELYEDVNVNLGNEHTKITNADQGASEQQNVSQESRFEQVEEDAHVTLTPVLDTQKADEPVQSFSVSSNFTSKLLNLKNPSPADNEIASLMETLTLHATAVPEITSRFATTIPPPPPFFNPLLQHETPTPTPTTSEATTLFTSLLDFASVFKFNERVTNLEKNLSSSPPQSSYEAALAELFEFEFTKVPLIDMWRETRSLCSYGDALFIERGVETTETKTRNPPPYGGYKDDEFKKPERPPTPDPDWNHRGCQIIPKDYFINNDLEYLKGGDLSRRYSTSVTKTKAATYELKWIEDLVPELWSPVQLKYDQHAYLVTSHWGPKRQSFYGYACNMTSYEDVYSKRRIIAITRLKIMKKYAYGHLEEIEVRRDDQKLYMFKEADFKRLRLQDIEDMLLLLVQQKLTNLTIDERYDLNVALCMYTRRIVIQRRVEDLQLGVESYQKKLNLTKPDTYRSNLKNKTAYTSYSDPHRIIYVDQYRRKRLMCADELHKFSNGTLNDVRSAFHDIAVRIRMEYLPMRKWSNLDKKKGSGYGSRYRQAALSKEVDVEFREVCWWKRIRE